MAKISVFGMLAHLVFGWPTVYPTGTTIYKPELCYNGYTLFSFEVGQPVARLINMNGEIVNEWEISSERSKFLENGYILVVARGENRSIQEYDWDHNLIWEYKAKGPVHHDYQRLENGNTLMIYSEVVPEEYMEKIRDKKRRESVIHSDVIIEVTPEKEVVWEWHECEHFDINWHNPMVSIGDWTHTNTIQALPENKWYDAGDSRFKPGNVLVSPRSLDTILIVDRESKEIVWKYTGDYKGGLSGQHEPNMIRKGLPGAGNILVFDNGASPTKSLAHAGETYVLEINPTTKEIVWKYENGQDFHSKYRGTVQRFPNGNTLICDSDGHRGFEVTKEGEIVWEYAVPRPTRFGRCYRYPYDYCPETKALGKPKETPILPPEIRKIR